MLLPFLGDVTQHLDDALVDGVHLGVKFQAGDAVADIYQRGRTVLAYDFTGCSGRVQGYRSIWSGNRLVGIAMEVEVLALPRRAAIECPFANPLHALHKFGE